MFRSNEKRRSFDFHSLILSNVTVLYKILFSTLQYPYSNTTVTAPINRIFRACSPNYTIPKTFKYLTTRRE